MAPFVRKATGLVPNMHFPSAKTVGDLRARFYVGCSTYVYAEQKKPGFFAD